MCAASGSGSASAETGRARCETESESHADESAICARAYEKGLVIETSGAHPDGYRGNCKSRHGFFKKHNDKKDGILMKRRL